MFTKKKKYQRAPDLLQFVQEAYLLYLDVLRCCRINEGYDINIAGMSAILNDKHVEEIRQFLYQNPSNDSKLKVYSVILYRVAPAPKSGEYTKNC